MATEKSLVKQLGAKLEANTQADVAKQLTQLRGQISVIDAKLAGARSSLTELNMARQQSIVPLKDRKKGAQAQIQASRVIKGVFADKALHDILAKEGIDSPEKLLASEAYAEMDEVKGLKELRAKSVEKRSEAVARAAKRRETRTSALALVTEGEPNVPERFTHEQIATSLNRTIDTLASERQALFLQTPEGQREKAIKDGVVARRGGKDAAKALDEDGYRKVHERLDSAQTVGKDDLEAARQYGEGPVKAAIVEYYNVAVDALNKLALSDPKRNSGEEARSRSEKMARLAERLVVPKVELNWAEATLREFENANSQLISTVQSKEAKRKRAEQFLAPLNKVMDELSGQMQQRVRGVWAERYKVTIDFEPNVYRNLDALEREARGKLDPIDKRLGEIETELTNASKGLLGIGNKRKPLDAEKERLTQERTTLASELAILLADQNDRKALRRLKDIFDVAQGKQLYLTPLPAVDSSSTLKDIVDRMQRQMKFEFTPDEHRAYDAYTKLVGNVERAEKVYGEARRS